MKIKVPSTKYRSRNLAKENNLGQKDQVKVEKTEQKEVT